MKKVYSVLAMALVLFVFAPMHKGLAAERSNNQTRLLFPFVTNQSGFDTGIAVANTTADPFGTTNVAGTCTFHYYGEVPGWSYIPPQTTAVIPAGGMITFSIGSGGVPYTDGDLAGFQGYVIAECEFPLAHGFYLITYLGNNCSSQGHAVVLPAKRTTKNVEERGQ